MNQQLVFEFGNLKLSVRSLGLIEAFGIAESYILEQEIRVIVAHAKQIDNPSERSAFVDRQHDRLPKGQDLRLRAAKLFQDPNAIPNELTVRFLEKAIVNGNPGTESLLQVLEGLEGSDVDRFVSMFTIVLGVDKKK